MALGSYAILGYVDPSRAEVDKTSPPNNLKLSCIEVTIGSTSDYSSGLTLTASSCGLAAIFGAFGMSLRQSGGTARPGLVGVWNANTAKFQIVQEQFNATTADHALTEITGAALAANDVLRVCLVGI